MKALIKKNGLNKKYVILILAIVILLFIYYFFKNRVIGSMWGSEGQFIKIEDTLYVEKNTHHHSSKDKLKYIGIVKYESGTKAKVYRIKNCEECIFAYDGTPKIFMKEK